MDVYKSKQPPGMARKTPSKKPPAVKPKPKFLTGDYYSNKENRGANGKEKDPVEVFCRLRPLKNPSDAICIKRVNDTTLQLVPFGNNKLELFYTFKYVFDDGTTQKELFDKVAQPLIKDLINGKNGLLFTYGITSSGKTFTVTGKSRDCGILPRTLDVLFNSIKDNMVRFNFIFKPDGQNGFEIRSTPDAVLEWQREKAVTRTPSSVSGTPKPRRREADDLKEWEQREKVQDAVDINMKGNAFSVFVSYVEIYNNYIYDLLEDDSSIDQLKTKQPISKVLREDKRRTVFVNNVKEVEVRSADEAFDLFVKGIKRRKMAHTALNTESSRSHSVFNIRVVQAPTDSDFEVIQDDKLLHVSQLSLVDLAGSERTHRTQNTGERLREAGNINNSLMALRNCIDLLRENQKYNFNKIVPYRDNKLTHLFKSYFEGEGKIKMIICVNPGSEDFDETLHVMKFAETTQEVLINRGLDIPMQFKNPYSIPRYISVAGLGPGMMESIGPSLPPIESLDYKDEKQWSNLIETIEQRKKNKLRQFELLRQDYLLFREGLVATDSESMLAKQQLSVLRNDIEAREHQIKVLENKCSQLEGGHEEYVRKIYNLEMNVENLENQLEENRRAMTDINIQHEKNEQQIRERLEHEKERIKRIFEKVLAEKQAKLEREQCLTQEKMHLVREILTAENTDWGFFRDYWDHIIPGGTPIYNANIPRGPGPSGASRQSTTTATPDYSTPSSAKRPKLASDQGTLFKSTPTVSSARSDDRVGLPHRSPKGIPVINPRHRRSLSTGNEKWIDHRPQANLDMGTVLQPKIKNKKSVPSVKDIGAQELRKSGKYSLTTHFADNVGEVETRVYKGDVIPSAAGGAQVIFSDVEKMVQESPCD